MQLQQMKQILNIIYILVIRFQVIIQFGNKNIKPDIPHSLEDIALPIKVQEALGIVSLFRDGVNIDILYNELKKYYERYKLKNPNEYSNYKHICRYEIDSYVEEEENEDAS